MKSIKLIVLIFIVLSLVAVPGFSNYAADNLAPTKAKADDSVKSNLININTADADTLMKLPRIGPKMAQRILDFRKENGKFKKIEELMKVKGIGEKTFKGFEHMVTI